MLGRRWLAIWIKRRFLFCACWTLMGTRFSMADRFRHCCGSWNGCPLNGAAPGWMRYALWAAGAAGGASLPGVRRRLKPYQPTFALATALRSRVELVLHEIGPARAGFAAGADCRDWPGVLGSHARGAQEARTMARGRADMSAVAALSVMRDRSHDRNWPLSCALGGTRTPNLLIRSKIRVVQISP